MSGYFYTLLVVSVCGALCSMLAWGGFERYIKYICSLICICLIIIPLREVDVEKALEFSEEFSFSTSETENGLYQISAELTEARAEEYINEIVFSQFGIKPLYININIDWTLTEPTIESITVALSHDDMGNAKSTEEYLFNALGGEVNVIEA